MLHEKHESSIRFIITLYSIKSVTIPYISETVKKIKYSYKKLCNVSIMYIREKMFHI